MSSKVGERLAYFDAVLFDVDGTLIHSSPGILGTMRYTFEKWGISLPESELKTFFGPPLRRTFGRYISDAEQVEQAVNTYRSYYHEKGQYQCTLFPGVLQMLEQLRDAGVTMCTATSKPVQVVQPMLQRLGLEPYFAMVGGASLDARLDTKEAVVRDVLSQPFMQGKRALMVGDRKDDVQGGLACGLPVAGILYGYGSLQELTEAGTCIPVKDCEELIDLILNGPSGSVTQEVIR